MFVKMIIKKCSIYCPDCEKLLKKARIEMSPEEWIYVWVCECAVDKRIQTYKSTGSGPKKKLAEVVC
jgi:RNase P subunit RPR2